jgi:hypothetical protein
MKHPCKAALAAHPCASPPAFRKRFGDFQPDHGTAVSLLFKSRNVIAE